MTVHHLSIGGMSCAGCVASVETALRHVAGVTEASVNFAEHTALVEGDVPEQALLQAVAAASFHNVSVHAVEHGRHESNHEARER